MSVARPLAAFARPATKPRTTLRREQHQADYSILVAVIALAAIGILMVYSSSAMRAYLRSDDTLAIVGPQIQWAGLGIVAMLLMMRVDYRYLRLVSIPLFAAAVVLLGLVLVMPETGAVRSVSVGGSARWLQLGPLPAIHPAEFAKLAMVVYLAHWMAKRGTSMRAFWGGTAAFLIIVVPVVALVFKEPDLGTTMVIALTAFAIFFAAGANLAHFAALGGLGLLVLMVGLRGYQMERIQAWLNPACSPWRWAARSAPGWGKAASPAGCSCRTRATTTSSRSSARSSGSSAVSSLWGCSSCSPMPGSGPHSAPPIRSAPCSRPGSRRG
jgi:cell division protein FtsW (lipid II flippase)